MSMMHVLMYLIFALQLALLSVWLPLRCQHLRMPWLLEDNQTSDHLKRRRLASLANLLLLSSGIVLLLLSLTGWLAQPVAPMFMFTTLQVLLLLVMRQWLPVAAAIPAKRKASLQRRSVFDFITPLERLQTILALFCVPALALILQKSGLWTKDIMQLWQLCAVSGLANLCLCAAIYSVVFRQRQHNQSIETEQTLPSQQKIQQKVSQYLSALIALNLLLMLLLLLGIFGTQPELLYIGISLLLQLMLVKSSSGKATA
jgi:hypothetical protein